MSEHTPLTEAERDEILRAGFSTHDHLLQRDPTLAAIESILAARIAEAEVAGQMKHITAEMIRGDQPLDEKEELIAELRARLSHAEAERDDLLAARTFDQPCTDDSDFAAMGREVGRRLAARTSTATADTGLRERVGALLLCGESAGLRHYYAIDGACQRCGLPSHVETQFRAALDATAAPTTDTGARDECPTCGPTTTEQHPRREDVTRCSNCKEWL